MRYTVVFLLVTLAAAILAFGGILSERATIARGAFVIFICLFLIAFVKEAANPPHKQ